MIEKLKYETMIGYGCIVTTTIRKGNIDAIKKTKAYELISHMLNPDNIVIDVITGSYRIRKGLADIIDTFTNNPDMRSNPKGCIVISSITDLGTTPSEIKKNYTTINNADIGILILNNETLSTVNYGCEYCKNYEERKKLLLELKKDAITTRQGRKKKPLIITPEFKQVYWLYENYFLSEKNTYRNTIINKITKVAFNQLCDLYENSIDYETDEKAALSENNDLIFKPKRHGAVPEYFNELVELVNIQGIPISTACSILNIPSMTSISFQRYTIKSLTGKSGIGKAVHKYTDLALNEALTKFN